MNAPVLQSPITTPRKHPRLSGAVLVGGASRRMGRPKAQLPFQNRSFLEQILVTIAPFVEQLAVVGGPNPEEALRGVRAQVRPDVEWIPDVVAHAGPLAGIIAALQRDPESDWLCIACDMPLIQPAAVQWLISQHRGTSTDVVAAQLSGSHTPEPFPAVYARSAIDPLRRTLNLGNFGPIHAIRSLRCLSPMVPTGLESSWLNINTIHDWELHCIPSRPADSDCLSCGSR